MPNSMKLPEPAPEAAPPRAETSGPSRARLLFVGLAIALVLLAAAGIAYRASAQRARRDSEASLRAPVDKVVARATEAVLKHRASATSKSCANPNCACVQSAIDLALDIELGTEAGKLLDRAAAECPSIKGVAGKRAEALVLQGDARGLAASNQVLSANPKDPHALFARALLEWRAGNIPNAASFADSASIAGRGGNADLLLGLLAYQFGDLGAALGYFLAVQKSDPERLDALYNIALIHQRVGDSVKARELYLQVVGANPKHWNAQHNLALLANTRGDKVEAVQRLAMLEAGGAPPDLIRGLRATLEHGVLAPAPSAR